MDGAIQPTSTEATQQLVDTAIEYAFDQDRDSITIVHQSDLIHSPGAWFRICAFEYLHIGYPGSIIPEAVFHEKYNSELQVSK